MKYQEKTETVWHKYECGGGGTRWTSADIRFENPAGKVCGFSGCNCGTLVKRIGTTQDRAEAGEWFRRP